MIHCKWEILQAKTFYATREREMGNKKKTAGDKNVCE
jgi:hypothetical protein